MLISRLIERKRDGHALTAAEWGDLVEAYVAGRVPDYQMAALLMAVVFRGLAPTELTSLTDAMLHSGDRLHFDGLDRPLVDKHSTGGVGDKTSLLLAPLVAACGAAIPMMSGRGLGHTGGTLDKLEAIPGFRTALSREEAEAQVRRIGCVMLGPTPEIAPADRRLYALRNVTGTVEAIPLICASIMSKKLAEGIGALVLDVKTGSGAFISDLGGAAELARAMIGIGRAHGCRTVALITAMDRPLGHACGNALEVEEAIHALHGEGPADLMEVTFALGSEMLVAAGLAPSTAEGRAQLTAAVRDGHALDRLRALIEAQGGNPAIVDDPAALPQAPCSAVFAAPAAGIVARVEPRRIGHAVIALGGGRAQLGDAIDPAVGFVVTVKPGQPVERGQPLATVHARDATGLEIGLQALRDAITVDGPADPLPLILQRLD